MKVRITKLDPRAVIPEYQTAGAAAFDLHVIENAVVGPGGAAFLRTGLVFGIPEDHVMLIMARSSLYKKFGLQLANQIGVLDATTSPEDECTYTSITRVTRRRDQGWSAPPKPSCSTDRVTLRRAGRGLRAAAGARRAYEIKCISYFVCRNIA